MRRTAASRRAEKLRAAKRSGSVRKAPKRAAVRRAETPRAVKRPAARKEQARRPAKAVKAPVERPVEKKKLVSRGQEAKSVAAPPSKPEARAGKAGKAGKLAKPSAPEPKAKLKGGEARKKERRREGRTAAIREPAPRIAVLPLPLLTPMRRPSIEERAAQIDARLNAQPEEFRRRYIESFDMSWIYHDSALEGVVYTFEELRAALNPPPQAVADSSLQPTVDDIRRHKEAIEYVRDFATKKRLPVTLDVIKKIYLILHPEEGDIKTVKYRKDIPQHRLYFHEYAPPDKIAYKVRQIVDWLSDPETRKTRNGIRIAARAHYDLLRVYPFATDSGKVARLFMNLLLMRTGLPPSILHSTERQRYYEALKGSATTVLQMVQEAVENALSSVEKLLGEQESRKRAFIS